MILQGGGCVFLWGARNAVQRIFGACFGVLCIIALTRATSFDSLEACLRWGVET